MTEITFVGLGGMGTAMARRLMDEGHVVHVWNRTATAADELVAAGATRSANIVDSLSTGLVFSMLANDAAVESVFTAEVLEAAPAGTIHVNHSTLSVAACERLTALHEAANVGYVAAPVLGRPNVAAAGNLSIVAAGPSASIGKVQRYLDILGKRTWIVGDRPSKASLLKIGINYNLIHTLQALAESVTLMEHGGVDGVTFVEILTDAFYTGTAYTGYGNLIARESYSPPGFTVALGLKDLSLAEQAALTLGVVLPSAPVLREMFERTLADAELAPLDWSAIAEITRRLARDSGRVDRDLK